MRRPEKPTPASDIEDRQAPANNGAISRASRRFAGVLLILIPTVIYGGTALLTKLIAEEQHIKKRRKPA